MASASRIETITDVLAGTVEHSMGNSGAIGDGDIIQWMTAGVQCRANRRTSRWRGTARSS